MPGGLARKSGIPYRRPCRFPACTLHTGLAAIFAMEGEQGDGPMLHHLWQRLLLHALQTNRLPRYSNLGND